MTVLTVGRFAGSGVGIAPKHPTAGNAGASRNATLLRYFFDFEREREYKKGYPVVSLQNHSKKINGGNRPMVNSNRDRKRILFVEDDKDNWEMLALNLKEHCLICASDFVEGLRLARQGYFDLYILDNWLPDGFGVELCRCIRAFDPNTPVLFYSAAVYPRDMQAAFRAGAQAYLTKPVSSDELTRAVARLISVQPEMAFEARLAELAAIREDLAIRQEANAERVERAKEKYLRAEEKYLRAKEKALRAKAQTAFLAAGGTRGDFAREWPSVLLEEVRGARTSAAVSD